MSGSALTFLFTAPVTGDWNIVKRSSDYWFYTQLSGFPVELLRIGNRPFISAPKFVSVTSSMVVFYPILRRGKVFTLLNVIIWNSLSMHISASAVLLIY
jgi:hypothetical protein